MDSCENRSWCINSNTWFQSFDIFPMKVTDLMDFTCQDSRHGHCAVKYLEVKLSYLRIKSCQLILISYRFKHSICSRSFPFLNETLSNKLRPQTKSDNEAYLFYFSVDRFEEWNHQGNYFTIQDLYYHFLPECEWDFTEP